MGSFAEAEKGNKNATRHHCPTPFDLPHCHLQVSSSPAKTSPRTSMVTDSMTTWTTWMTTMTGSWISTMKTMMAMESRILRTLIGMAMTKSEGSICSNVVIKKTPAFYV